MMNKSQIKKRLKEMKIHPKKSLGQNFLMNSDLLNTIVDSVRDLHPKNIIEIGPGLGSLTDPLSQLDVSLCLVEMDRDVCRFWREKNFDVIEGDVLRLRENPFCKRCTLVGNLPYHISNQLMIQASLQWEKIENMVVMFQKEVAERILSPCGNKKFGLLSVVLQCLWDISFLGEAKTGDFYPPPKVKGWVLVFKRKPKPDLNVNEFFKFVKICFAQRRKFLKKRLLQNYGEKIENIFKKMNLSYRVRAEEISPSQFMEMYRFLFSS